MGWLSAILGLAGLLGGGKGVENTGANPDQQKLINETLANQTRRMNLQNPLYEAVQKLAMRLMPTAVQQPIPTWRETRATGSYDDSFNSGSGSGTGSGSGAGTDPSKGREDPDPTKPDRDRGLTSGVNGITPGTLAQLFKQR
jgi:hypothetical protein